MIFIWYLDYRYFEIDVCSTIFLIQCCASLIAQSVKNLSANAGDLSSIPELGKSPRVGNGNPLFPEESHRQRNLVGYSLLLLLLSHFSRVRLCATPWTAAHQAPPSMGVQRIGHD